MDGTEGDFGCGRFVEFGSKVAVGSEVGGDTSVSLFFACGAVESANAVVVVYGELFGGRG